MPKSRRQRSVPSSTSMAIGRSFATETYQPRQSPATPGHRSTCRYVPVRADASIVDKGSRAYQPRARSICPCRHANSGLNRHRAKVDPLQINGRAIRIGASVVSPKLLPIGQTQAAKRIRELRGCILADLPPRDGRPDHSCASTAPRRVWRRHPSEPRPAMPAPVADWSASTRLRPVGRRRVVPRSIRCVAGRFGRWASRRPGPRRQESSSRQESAPRKVSWLAGYPARGDGTAAVGGDNPGPATCSGGNRSIATSRGAIRSGGDEGTGRTVEHGRSIIPQPPLSGEFMDIVGALPVQGCAADDPRSERAH